MPTKRDIEQWYVARFLALRETVFRDPRSYFHRYASLSDEEAIETAREIWRTINGVNLRENIEPTRERARLILEKGADHAVRRVRLRRPERFEDLDLRFRDSSFLLRFAAAPPAAPRLRRALLSFLVGLEQKRRHRDRRPAVVIDRDERQVGDARQLSLAGQRAFRQHLDLDFERRRERRRHASPAG